MTLFQVTAVWSGITGAPGYSNFQITNAGIRQTAINNGVAAVRDFFNAIYGLLPSTASVQVQQDVKEFDIATGVLVGLGAASTTPAVVNGFGGNSGPAPAGLCIAWGTNGVNRGRKVRGRTFIVPLAASAYEANGTLNSTTLSTANSAATAYRTSGAYETLVWSRPRAGAGGAAFPIISSAIKDKAAVLRSRRD